MFAPQLIRSQAVSGSNTFHNCSSEQEASLTSARNAASSYAAGAVAYFNANKQGLRYTTWFGVYDLSRYNTVSSNFSAISSAEDTAPVDFDCSCPAYPNNPGVLAYVYPTLSYNIYLCSAYWGQPMTGTDSKAGVLIHEMSHFTVVAGTNAHFGEVYGQAAAKDLAITDPDHAIVNADSHEYFAENTPPLETSPTFTISGNAGVASATLTYTGGSTTANGSGDYSFSVSSGWSGTVTPSKAGYTFAPVSKTYTNVVSNQPNQNYIATALATYTISGNAGIAGATLTYEGGAAFADVSGNYSFTVQSGWSGTVTPAKAGYTFTPPNRTYTNVVSDWTAQDYAATVISSYSISGNAGVAGATLTYTGGSTTADGSGFYTFEVPPGWSGTVTPSKAGYIFFPVNRTYTNVVFDQIVQNYLGNSTTLTFTISGDAGAADTTLAYDGGSTLADGSGLYSFTVPYGWSGMVTPSKADYSFTPINRTYVNVISDQAGQDYAAIANFTDVPTSYWAWDWIARLFKAGITTGCSTDPLLYCPEDPVTRAQMAAFLERGMNGSVFSPPAGTGAVFADVPLSYWAVNWIEKLFADGITAGCSASPLAYCPDDSVTRAQMAVFLLRAEHGSTYTPPAAAGVFTDVPTTYWAADWIEQLYAEGITTGCGTSPLVYCPEDPVTRAQMAVFLVKTFHLP